MSPASTTHSESLPSSPTSHSAPNSHTIYHTNPTFSSIWTIIALTFVVVVVSGVLCYSIYSCYQSAVYQHQLEIAESIRQQVRSRKYLSTESQLDREKERLSEARQSLLESEHNINNSVTSFTSCSTMPDLASPPLAVTYSIHTRTPYMQIPHASPISSLPSPTEYTSVKLSPVSTPPVFFDSNSIPFYQPELLGSTLPGTSPAIDPKLAPIGGSFEYGCKMGVASRTSAPVVAHSDFPDAFPRTISNPSTNINSRSKPSSSVTTNVPRPESLALNRTSARLSRTRTTSSSFIKENCDPFARAAPVSVSVPVPVSVARSSTSTLDPDLTPSISSIPQSVTEGGETVGGQSSHELIRKGSRERHASFGRMAGDSHHNTSTKLKSSSHRDRQNRFHTARLGVKLGFGASIYKAKARKQTRKMRRSRAPLLASRSHQNVID